LFEFVVESKNVVKELLPASRDLLSAHETIDFRCVSCSRVFHDFSALDEQDLVRLVGNPENDTRILEKTWNQN
jgi:hypothetical protein